MDFKQELGKRTEEIEAILRTCAPKEEGYQKTIFQAMNYSLMAGGKASAADADSGDLPAVRRQP